MVNSNSICPSPVCLSTSLLSFSSPLLYRTSSSLVSLPAKPALWLQNRSPAPSLRWRWRSPRGIRRWHVLNQASSEGVPAEMLQDSKFVPINDDDPQFGPPAMMLMGFPQDEMPKVQELLRNMDGEFMKVLLCTNEMIKGSLWDALNSCQSDLTKIKVAKRVPRICFLSGLTGEEIMMFMRAFSETNLKPTIFAALVPRNAQKTVEELMEEIVGDHERLTAGQESH